MSSLPLTFAGHIYSPEGNPISEACVYLYNKTLDETKCGYDAKFPELITNEDGEYMGNLANFDGDWTIGDEIYYSAFYEDKAQSGNYTITGNPISDRDLTLKNLESEIAIIKLLLMKLTDPNSANRSTNEKWIRPKYSRRELTKNNYPIITVNITNEKSEDAALNSNKAEERTTTIEIKIYVWSKSGDAQTFTIDNVIYEGTKLRDYLARKISEILRKEFYQRPSYNKNAIIHKFYDYSKTKMENKDFDEERDNNVMEKVIELELKNIIQEV